MKTKAAIREDLMRTDDYENGIRVEAIYTHPQTMCGGCPFWAQTATDCTGKLIGKCQWAKSNTFDQNRCGLPWQINVLSAQAEQAARDAGLVVWMAGIAGDYRPALRDRDMGRLLVDGSLVAGNVRLVLGPHTTAPNAFGGVRHANVIVEGEVA
ncbi:hypothetical protein M0R72_05855 [Candidatus Pacearchaeota archaeon]|nr:hypothetical protein [Candidatus Pacearchaeota archaeon]